MVAWAAGAIARRRWSSWSGKIEVAAYVQDGQIFVLMPGSGGSLEFVKIFKQKKVKKEIAFAESCTLPYGARLKSSGHVSVLIHAVVLPTGVFPARKTEKVISKLR